MRFFGGNFATSDFFQQVVGGFLLAGPFVVTEEVWMLAETMHWSQTIGVILMTGFIAWGSLYEADSGRLESMEADVGGIPSRLLSLLVVSYVSVAILTFLFSAPAVFEAGTLTTITAIAIGSVFSTVGAATADSIF